MKCGVSGQNGTNFYFLPKRTSSCFFVSVFAICNCECVVRLDRWTFLVCRSIYCLSGIYTLIMLMNVIGPHIHVGRHTKNLARSCWQKIKICFVLAGNATNSILSASNACEKLRRISTLRHNCNATGCRCKHVCHFNRKQSFNRFDHVEIITGRP